MKLILTLILFLSASMANADKIYSKPYIRISKWRNECR